MCTPSTPTTCTAHKPEVTVVVPVYNNAGSLTLLNDRLCAALGSMGGTNEIIYVNDGSTDSSFDVLKKIDTSRCCVKVLDLTRNVGQSAAVLAALSEASGDTIVTIDADLENHPEDIPALVAAVRGGADFACGVRGKRQAPLLTRRGPSWLANRLVGRALNIDLKDWGCGLNAVRSEIARQMLAQDPLPRLPKIEAAMLSTTIVQLPVAYSRRQHGRSGYTVWRLAGFAASFLGGFDISRTFRRIIKGASAPSRWTSTAVSIACWAILSIAALLVQIVSRIIRPMAPNERFQIREILD